MALAVFQHLKGTYKKSGDGLFTRVCNDRTRGKEGLKRVDFNEI